MKKRILSVIGVVVFVAIIVAVGIKSNKNTLEENVSVKEETSNESEDILNNIAKTNEKVLEEANTVGENKVDKNNEVETAEEAVKDENNLLGYYIDEEDFVIFSIEESNKTTYIQFASIEELLQEELTIENDTLKFGDHIYSYTLNEDILTLTENDKSFVCKKVEEDEFLDFVSTYQEKLEEKLMDGYEKEEIDLSQYIGDETDSNLIGYWKEENGLFEFKFTEDFVNVYGNFASEENEAFATTWYIKDGLLYIEDFAFNYEIKDNTLEIKYDGYDFKLNKVNEE